MDDFIITTTRTINATCGSRYKERDVEYALETPLSFGGFITRIVERHGSYLKYFRNSHTFAVRARLHGDPRMKYHSIPDSKVFELISREFERLHQEVNIVRDASRCGIITTDIYKDFKQKQIEFESIYTTNAGKGDLIEELKVRLETR